MHAVRKAGHVAALLVVVLLSAPAANAQSTATVTLTAAAPGAWTDGMVSAPLTVGLTLDNIICPADTTATVSIAAPDPTPVNGLTFAYPSSVSFPVKAGAYSVNGKYTNSATVYLNATVTAAAPSNHEHALNVTASFNASGLPGCQAATQTTKLDSSVSVTVTFTTPMGTGSGGNTTQTTSPSGTGSGTTSKPAITLPFAVQVGAIVGMGALMVRRKK